MTKAQAGPAYIENSDFQRLKGIAENLSKKYPSDWLERFWHGKNIHVFLAAIVLGLLIAQTSLPLWSAFLPFFVASILFRYLPTLVLHRKMHAPRWAHPKASLSSAEVSEIESVVQRLKPVQRNVVAKYLPATTGDRFWLIWSSAQAYAAGNAHASEEFTIGWREIARHLLGLALALAIWFVMLQGCSQALGFDFSQWLLSNVENYYFRTIIQILTMPHFTN